MRLYAQLGPDGESGAHLQALQAALPRQQNGRVVPAHELHITLIHFGDIEAMFERVTKVGGIERAAYLRYLEQYIGRTQKLLPADTLRLEPEGLQLLGRNGSTLAVAYQPTEALVALHAKLYAALLDFLVACMVKDPTAFISADSALGYAGALTPHITLYKGYAGPLPGLDLAPVQVLSMPFRYS